MVGSSGSVVVVTSSDVVVVSSSDVVVVSITVQATENSNDVRFPSASSTVPATSP